MYLGLYNEQLHWLGPIVIREKRNYVVRRYLYVQLTCVLLSGHSGCTLLSER